MKHKPEVLEWCRKADEDSVAASELAARWAFKVPNVVCFHCQQTCEKYLKAYLIHRGQSPPWVHDLDDLLDLCAEKDGSFEDLRDIMSPLTPYAVEYRYPGISATVEEAEEALQGAQYVREFVRRKLGFE